MPDKPQHATVHFEQKTRIDKACAQSVGRYAIQSVLVTPDGCYTEEGWLTATDGHVLVMKKAHVDADREYLMPTEVIPKVKAGGCVTLETQPHPSGAFDENGWVNAKGKKATAPWGDHVHFPPANEVVPKLPIAKKKEDEEYVLLAVNAHLLANVQDAMGAESLQLLIKKPLVKDKGQHVNKPILATAQDKEAIACIMPVSTNENPTSIKKKITRLNLEHKSARDRCKQAPKGILTKEESQAPDSQGEANSGDVSHAPAPQSGASQGEATSGEASQPEANQGETTRDEVDVNDGVGAVGLETIMAAVENDEMVGFCTACGHEQGPLEPDAENVKCEECGECKVTGAENLLILCAA